MYFESNQEPEEEMLSFVLTESLSSLEDSVLSYSDVALHANIASFLFI